MPVAVPPLRACRAHAIAFLLRAYDDASVRPGKGLPHAQAVADVLRDAGADEPTQVAGLLHDVVEDTACTLADVEAAFGDRLARVVDALTEDASVDRYELRKRKLRGRTAAAGQPAMDVSLADKIASLRYALITGDHVSKRTLSHYRATLRLGCAAGASPPLCAQLEDALADVSGVQPFASFASDPTT